ncbi:MAG: TolC family protein [Planctomycetota bacterium]
MITRFACLAAAVLAATSCSSTPHRAVAPCAPPVAPTFDGPLTPEQAAAAAVARSPRVEAAAARLRADESRARAAALPPDPTIVLATGIPLDDASSAPVRVSIMSGISWLFTRNAATEAARTRCQASAAMLVATAAEVAAEARMLVASAIAARAGADAATRAAEAARRLVESDDAMLRHGELAPFERERHLAMAARAQAEAAGLAAEAEAFEAALRSLLAIDSLPPLADDQESHATFAADSLVPAEIAAARRAVAEADDALAAVRADGLVEASIGFERDMEGDESVALEARVSLPAARRPHLAQALEAEATAARADLAEAERSAALRMSEARRNASARLAARDALECAARAGTDMHRASLAALAAGEVARHEADLIELDSLELSVRAARAAIELAAARRDLQRLLVPEAHDRINDDTRTGATP